MVFRIVVLMFGACASQALLSAQQVSVRASQAGPGQVKDAHAASARVSSGEQGGFRHVSIGDGKLEGGTWFHQAVDIAPDGNTVTILSAKFESADMATK